MKWHLIFLRLKPVFKYLRNRYLLATLGFVVWMLFFDNNNLFEHLREWRQIRSLERDILYYQEEIEQTEQRLKDLRTNDDNLERFAREEYLMRRSDEDVFIIVD
ncbi:MAG: FtsB family cell division protein [Bacteroidales bacterium]